MFRSSFFAALAAFAFGTITAEAQSIVDPGISTHNYKHPNKAAQAKAAQQDKGVRVASIKTIESYYKRQNRVANSTPKYAPRPAALVVTKTFEKEANNPHLSPRNYKAQNTYYEPKNNLEVADFKDSPDSTAYPNVD